MLRRAALHPFAFVDISKVRWKLQRRLQSSNLRAVAARCEYLQQLDKVKPVRIEFARLGRNTTACVRTIHFAVSPRLAALLGDGYRSTEQALKELVENAWDADAEVVKVTLPAPMTLDPIVISDNGHGMTPEEIEAEYLNIARDRRSIKGARTPRMNRRVKGKLGIGKFAGLAAARRMLLQSVRDDRRASVTAIGCRGGSRSPWTCRPPWTTSAQKLSP